MTTVARRVTPQNNCGVWRRRAGNELYLRGVGRRTCDVRLAMFYTSRLYTMFIVHLSTATTGRDTTIVVESGSIVNFQQQHHLSQSQQPPLQCHPQPEKMSPVTSEVNRNRRRSGWTDSKQKSRSFDFSWRSGMWSPLDATNGAGTASQMFPMPSSIVSVDRNGLLAVPGTRPAVSSGGCLSGGAGRCPATTGAATAVSPSTTPINTSGGPMATTASSTPKLGECRKSSPRLKLPPMFQMDSGSSYESYDAAECFPQQHEIRVSELVKS